MTWWKHKTQRGGYISLHARRRTPVRWDGLFEAPDDPTIEARLEAAGHAPSGAPDEKDEEPVRETDKQRRQRLRRERREREAAWRAHAKERGQESHADARAKALEQRQDEPKGAARPVDDGDLEVVTLDVLKDWAEDAGVAKSGTKATIAARLTEEGIDVGARIQALDEEE